MAKKDKAVYAPGELSRVRNKLGPLDKEEAKLLAEKLGGEIGYERDEETDNPRVRQERVEVKIGDRPGRTPKRRVELAGEDFSASAEAAPKKAGRGGKMNPADDPSVQLKPSYWDRIKMDKYAGQSEFEIKSPGQVFHSMISLFGEIPDMVSPAFVSLRLPEYVKKIEVLVASTRTLFPRNNIRRNERMKKSSPLVYTILDIIRYWEIEKISGELGRLQSNRKASRVSDFFGILRAFYKPIFILNRLDTEAHIRGAFKILYKQLYIENPMEAQNKYQDLIRTALAAYSNISIDIHYLMYPLLMKAVSAKFVPYEKFFIERKNRIMSFLNVSEADQINPAEIPLQTESGKESKEDEEEAEEVLPENEDGKGGETREEEEEISEEEKNRRAAADSEKKAMEKGLQTLEMLFPKAGWDRLSSYPDLYPYFVELFSLRKGIVNIAPTDPMLQILIFMRILEDLFFGLRFVSFGTIAGSGNEPDDLGASIGDIVNNWHYFIEQSYEKEYLPRMAEYVRILEGSVEERVSMYTKKLITELHWLKRLYFLPYYKFESLVPPPFQKGEIPPIYAKIRELRKCLTAVAGGIERGNKNGGAEKHAPCDGIDNPWEPYVFEVPNPLSIRLNALLAPKSRNNAALIYFCLAITTVLDKLVNTEDSWAYSPRPGPLFRSVNGEGVSPLTGVDAKIDAEGLFKQAQKQRAKST